MRMGFRGFFGGLLTRRPAGMPALPGIAIRAGCGNRAGGWGACGERAAIANAGA